MRTHTSECRTSSQLTDFQEMISNVLCRSKSTWKLNVKNHQATGHDGIGKKHPQPIFFFQSKSTVVCIPIPGKPLSGSTSYRPISLLSCLIKVVQKIILARLEDFADSNHILPNCQRGFCRKDGCGHQFRKVAEIVSVSEFPLWPGNSGQSWGDSLRPRLTRAGVTQGTALLLLNIFTQYIPTHPKMTTGLYTDDIALISSRQIIVYSASLETCCKWKQNQGIILHKIIQRKQLEKYHRILRSRIRQKVDVATPKRKHSKQNSGMLQQAQPIFQ